MNKLEVMKLSLNIGVDFFSKIVRRCSGNLGKFTFTEQTFGKVEFYIHDKTLIFTDYSCVKLEKTVYWSNL